MHIVLHVDGGARGNPGPAAAGVCITDRDTAAPLLEAGFWLGQTTNNEAEYQGLIRGLDAAIKLSPTTLVIHADSELMVRQVQGKYRVKAANLKPLFRQVADRLAELPEWSIEHVRRNKNERADELANLAMDAERDVIVSAHPKG
ncbi:MAG: ribonuclease HI family protein [Planctomycetota bacterium]